MAEDNRWRINITVSAREYLLIQKKAKKEDLSPTTWSKQQLMIAAKQK